MPISDLVVADLFHAFSSSPEILPLLLSVVVVLSGAYIRVATVLTVLRGGFGLHGLPSSLVTGSLAVVLSFFVMQTTVTRVFEGARGFSSVPAEQQGEKIEQVLVSWKDFLRNNSGSVEIKVFRDIQTKMDHKQNLSNPEDQEGLSLLLIAFMVTQLKIAFTLGLSLFMPFLVIDLLVANSLAAVGVGQLNPLVVAFPLKLFLFVVVDGWTLIASGLAGGFS